MGDDRIFGTDYVRVNFRLYYARGDREGHNM